MESQIVVDHTELDGNGFLMGRANPTDEFRDEVKSLKLRADSRDSAALELDESTEGKYKYMLSLESRELRIQASTLQKRRSELMAPEPAKSSATDGFSDFADSPAIG